MKTVANLAIAIGMVSLLVGIILKLAAKQMALGLAPASFLGLSTACFLLTIAINTKTNK